MKMERLIKKSESVSLETFGVVNPDAGKRAKAHRHGHRSASLSGERE